MLKAGSRPVVRHKQGSEIANVLAGLAGQQRYVIENGHELGWYGYRANTITGCHVVQEVLGAPLHGYEQAKQPCLDMVEVKFRRSYVRSNGLQCPSSDGMLTQYTHEADLIRNTPEASLIPKLSVPDFAGEARSSSKMRTRPRPSRRWRWNYRIDPVEASSIVAGARRNLERVHKQAQRLLANAASATLEMLSSHLAILASETRVLEETTKEIRTKMMPQGNSAPIELLDEMDRALDEVDRAEGIIQSANQTTKLIEERHEQARLESIPSDRGYKAIIRKRKEYRAMENIRIEDRAKIEALIDEFAAQQLLEKLDPIGDSGKFNNLTSACDRIAGISREQRLEMTIASLKRGRR